jgi:hypothetical protein
MFAEPDDRFGGDHAHVRARGVEEDCRVALLSPTLSASYSDGFMTRVFRA